jgi:hypothetical protein
MPAGRCEECTCREIQVHATAATNEPAILCMSGEHESRRQACRTLCKQSHCLLHWPASVVVHSSIAMESSYAGWQVQGVHVSRDAGACHGSHQRASDPVHVG